MDEEDMKDAIIKSDLRKQYKEYSLLLVLSVMWGSSYLLIKIAITDIPPITLIASRVAISSLILLFVLFVRNERLPTGTVVWKNLFFLSILNSIGAWTILAWGQKYVDSSLASILNSTTPVFLVIFTWLFSKDTRIEVRVVVGTAIGLAGVILIIGYQSLLGLGNQVLGQLACLAGAAFYGGAAIYALNFQNLSSLQISTCTMIWATAVTIPTAVVIEHESVHFPSYYAIFAAVSLAIFCTAFALLIYFRLVRTLGSLGAASQSYLRVGVGVALGVFVLGERMSLLGYVGLFLCVLGVLLINWPKNKRRFIQNTSIRTR